MNCNTLYGHCIVKKYDITGEKIDGNSFMKYKV